MEDSNIEMHMGRAKWAEMAETLDDETKKKNTAQERWANYA